MKDREKGESLASIGQRHGLTSQGTGVIVNKARQQIDGVELAMLRAVKTGEHPTLLIPHGPDYHLGLAYIRWVQDELERRDVRFTVTTKQTKAGTAFQLEQEHS